MAKTSRIMAFWDSFQKSSEYKIINNYPQWLVQETVQYFDKMMAKIYPGSFRTWNEDKLLDVLYMMLDQADDEDSDANHNFWINFDIISELLRYLADTNKIGIGKQDLEEMFVEFQEHTDANDPDEEIREMRTGELCYVSTDPWLPEWKEYIAINIERYTLEWVDAYTESSDWHSRPDGIDKAFLSMILNNLAKWAYDDYRKTPKSWTKMAITGVLTDSFVSDLSLEPESYKLIAPALSHFLTYVAKRGWLNEKRASDYKRFIAAAVPDMIELSQDEDNFSPSKLITMKMNEDGVDITDEKAIQAYITKVSQNGEIDDLYDDYEADDSMLGFPPEEVRKITKHPEQLKRLAEVYDPDPDQNYLNSVHLPEFEDRRWRRKTAIAVHAQGVQAGLSLWLNRQDYKLPKNWDAVRVVQNVSVFVDLHYAQALLKPTEWPVPTFRDFGEWARAKQSGEHLAATNQLVPSLLAELTDDGTLEREQGKQLTAAFFGKSIPKPDKPKKVKGKVISLKQARKLLKHKKRY
ncbi:hypothetical protein [Pediococcus damnosus]|uniref:hypothetical protein n=1 Tax=Pediococcus damnosus TaxID=51663 RepID=UPI003F6C984F